MVSPCVTIKKQRHDETNLYKDGQKEPDAHNPEGHRVADGTYYWVSPKVIRHPVIPSVNMQIACCEHITCFCDRMIDESQQNNS